jgi:thymidylate kinase
MVCRAIEVGPVVCDRYLPSAMAIMMADGTLEEAEISRLFGAFEPYAVRPSLTIVLTTDHATARRRIEEQADDQQTLKPQRRRVYDSVHYFDRYRRAILQQATRLGPAEELDTTRLSAEEGCRSAWGLVARRLEPSGPSLQR